jgi:LEA14-like dessication related protein
LSVSLLESSFEGQRFDVRLQLANPNAAALPVRQLDFDVRLGGEGILVGRYQVPFTLPPQGIETVQLEIFSDTVSSVSRLMSMAQGPENALNYEIQGEITLDAGLREPVVFYSRGRVPLTSTRE